MPPLSSWAVMRCRWSVTNSPEPSSGLKSAVQGLHGLLSKPYLQLDKLAEEARGGGTQVRSRVARKQSNHTAARIDRHAAILLPPARLHGALSQMHVKLFEFEAQLE